MLRLGYAILAIAFVATCTGVGAASAPPFERGAAKAAVSAAASGKKQHIYWSLFAPVPQIQIESASLPLRGSSKITQIDGDAQNMLDLTSAMFFDAGGTLWLLAAPSGDDCAGGGVADFPGGSLDSSPQAFALLSGACDPDHLAFDADGNLWVTSHANAQVLEYAGPFPRQGTLQPALALTKGFSFPSGLAFDSAGTLYVSNFPSTGKNSIAVFTAPISNRKPDFYLTGLAAPGGLIVDSAGNLYASTNAMTGAIVRYNRNAIRSGARPSIVDPAGLPANPYESDFAFDAAGNLYDADCGSAPGIFAYPTAKKSFSPTLMPTFFSDTTTRQQGCAWGIAIH